MTKPASIYKQVGFASIIMMLSVFLSRVIGLGREMSIAYMAGAGADVDAYQIAFVIPEILNHVVATGFLSITFIPIFSKYIVANNEAEGWRVFSIVASIFACLATVIIALCMLLAPWLVTWVAPGVENASVVDAAVHMTRIILPAQLCFFLGGLFMAVQFAKGHFVLPALAPLIYNLGIILGGLCLGPWLGVSGFAWGVLGGAIVGNLLLQWIGARRIGMRFHFSFDFRHRDIKTYVLLTLPLMVGLTMTFSTEFLFRFFGSYLPSGSIAVLNFGLRVTLMLVGFFGQAVGTASYPFMARLAADNKLAELNQLLNKTLRYLALVMPLSMLLMLLSPELVRILFERGRFSSDDAVLTAQVLRWFLLGASALAASTVVVRGFYATRNTLLPALYGSAIVVVSVPIFWTGAHFMGPQGVALAVSLSSFAQVAVLFVLWSRRSHNADQRQVYIAFVKMIALSAVMALPLWALHNGLYALHDFAGLFGSIEVFAIVAAVFLPLLLGLGRILHIEEIDVVTQHIFRRLTQRRNSV